MAVGNLLSWINQTLLFDRNILVSLDDRLDIRNGTRNVDCNDVDSVIRVPES